MGIFFLVPTCWASLKPVQRDQVSSLTKSNCVLAPKKSSLDLLIRKGDADNVALELRTNPSSSYPKYSLLSAALSGKGKIVEILLQDPRFDPRFNDGGKKSVEAALIMRNFGIIKAFLRDGRLDISSEINGYLSELIFYDDPALQQEHPFILDLISTGIVSFVTGKIMARSFTDKLTTIFKLILASKGCDAKVFMHDPEIRPLLPETLTRLESLIDEIKSGSMESLKAFKFELIGYEVFDLVFDCAVKSNQTHIIDYLLEFAWSVLVSNNLNSVERFNFGRYSTLPLILELFGIAFEKVLILKSFVPSDVYLQIGLRLFKSLAFEAVLPRYV